MTSTGTCISAAAYVNGVSLCSTLRGSCALILKTEARSRTCSSAVTCALATEDVRRTRRVISLSLVLLGGVFSLEKDAMSASVLDKYLKKKKLDPLESYIPAVLLTERQIAELGDDLDADSPRFADCRNLLRSGPASSLRVNIRAVAQYASDAGKGPAAFSEVDECLRALEELDSLLLRASRNDPNASIEPMKARIVAALNALNRLLKTVPDDVLDKGKAMAEAYLTPGEDFAPESVDPQLTKQLQSIL